MASEVTRACHTQCRGEGSAGVRSGVLAGGRAFWGSFSQACVHPLQDCPFIVCMTYAFHTPDKLCFILDLMNGKQAPGVWLPWRDPRGVHSELVAPRHAGAL